ncbi:MAG: hypothetical protein WC749_03045 [Dehalococcoidia bacterium]
MKTKLSRLLFLSFIIAGFAFVFHGARAVDLAPPDQVKDLAVATSTDATLTLTWTAPGDDGMSGTVSQYDLRMDTKAIAAEDGLLAPIVGGEPDPLPGGTPQTMVIKDLLPGTKYWFIIRAQDKRANVSKFSNVAMGETLFDTTSPVISKIKVADIGPSSARVTWITDEPATSDMQYGTTSAYGLNLATDTKEKEHAFTLFNLEPETLYYYILGSTDNYGNKVETVNMTFETAATPLSPSASTPTSTNAATGQTLSQPITLKFTPRAINLTSKAKWMTAVLTLPKELRAGMKFDTLLINGRVKPIVGANQKVLQANLNKYGTLWMKVARADLAHMVPPEVAVFEFSLTGQTAGGEFAVTDTLKVANNITKAEWNRRMEAKRAAFEQVKAALIKKLEKEIAALKTKLEAAEKKLEDAKSSQFGQ